MITGQLQAGRGARRVLQGLTECMRRGQDRIIECMSAGRGRLALVQPKYPKTIKSQSSSPITLSITLLPSSPSHLLSLSNLPAKQDKMSALPLSGVGPISNSGAFYVCSKTPVARKKYFDRKGPP